MIAFDISAGQIQGARERQEDRYAIRQFSDLVVAMIADGLGGHPCGDRAAQLAIDTIDESIQHALLGHSIMSRPAMLSTVVEAAHRRVKRLGGRHRDPLRVRNCHGMATTLIVACVSPGSDRMHYAYVGDSLLLRLSPDGIQAVCLPHSAGDLVLSAVGIGFLTQRCPEEGIPVALGDRFLLATDGLESVPDREITHILRNAATAESAVTNLLAAVEAAYLDYQDNATVIALFVEEESA